MDGVTVVESNGGAMETTISKTEVVVRNILLMTDFFSPSEKALQYAVAIAKGYDSKIHLVHVIEPTAAEVLTGEPLPKHYERQHKIAEQELGKQTEELGNVSHQTYIKHGTVSEVVQAVMRENQIDLVMAGTQGARGLEKLVLGSTAEEIFRTVTCRFSRLDQIHRSRLELM